MKEANEKGMVRQGLIFCGDKGEAVFTEPFIDYQWSPNELPGFLQRIYSTGDDRSFVVMSLNVIDKHIDSLLEGIAPSYECLASNKDFTVSMKIDLLRAFRLIPLHILQATDLARRIRNEFAHNLNCDRLDQLPPKFKEPMANLVRAMFGDAAPYSTSVKESFKALIFLALAGLQAYRPNFIVLREKLEEGRLTEDLKQECHKRFMEGITIRQSKEPLRVEERDGWRYAYYEDGLVSISAADPQNPPVGPCPIPA